MKSSRHLDAHIRTCLRSGRYEVTDEGEVISLSYLRTGKPRILAKRINAGGYVRIGLLGPIGRIRECMLHRVVAYAKLGPPPRADLEINHKNGDKLDNRPSNLEWCDRPHNLRHAWRLGLRRPTGIIGLKGAASCRAKLTEEQVRTIHQRTATTTQRALAAEFSVKPPTISLILSGKNWPEIYREFHP